MKTSISRGALLAACGTSTTAGPSSNSVNVTTPTSAGDSGMSMSPTSTVDPMAGMDHGGGSSGPAGLAVDLVSSIFQANKPVDLSFKIVAADGSTVTKYQAEQTKELHLILVRSDLTGYQHLHPTRSTDGTWKVNVTFARGGVYKMVADSAPIIAGEPYARVALTTDLNVSGPGEDVKLPPASPTANVDGYTVTVTGGLASTNELALTFAVVDKAGKPVTLETYLGAFGHLVAFAQADLAYSHIHPQQADQQHGTIEFMGQSHRTRPAPTLPPVRRRRQGSHGRVHDQRHVTVGRSGECQAAPLFGS